MPSTRACSPVGPAIVPASPPLTPPAPTTTVTTLAVTVAPAVPLVRGALSPDRPPRPCLIASPSWCAWYFLLGIFNLCPVEIYGPSSCPWMDHAATLLGDCPWFLWSDFPQSVGVSALWAPDPLVVILHSDPSIFELLPPVLFVRHDVLLLVPTATPSIPHFPYQCSVSHREAGGVLAGSWDFISNRLFGMLTPAPRCYPLQFIK
jgi:hypothetical protein